MTQHGTVREGLIAGTLGAVGVAAWFLIVDTIAARPFYTPSVLGSAVTALLWPGREMGVTQHVVIYTILHFAAFFAIGVSVTAIVHASARQPAILAGLLILFVAFEAGFYFFTYALSLWAPLQEIAWYQIGAANILAALLMGGYLWRGHRRVARQLDQVLSGR